jgi:hypothetical protein
MPTKTEASRAPVQGRVGGDVKFCSFALVREAPEKIIFQEHLIPYKGMDDDFSLPWGVYGSTSLVSATYVATSAARVAGKRSLVLNAHINLPNFAVATQRLPNSIDQADGFLHMGRLGKSLREEIHADFLLFLKRTKREAVVKEMAALDWAQLLIQEPKQLRAFMLEKLPTVRVMVHPVLQTMYEHPRMKVLQIGSFRLDKDVWAEVAHNDSIEVSFA